MESLQMESKDMPEEQQIHNKILESLETIWMGRELYCYSKVTSTNVVAKEKILSFVVEPTQCIKLQKFIGVLLCDGKL